jgi:hypothetical protein
MLVAAPKRSRLPNRWPRRVGRLSHIARAGTCLLDHLHRRLLTVQCRWILSVTVSTVFVRAMLWQGVRTHRVAYGATGRGIKPAPASALGHRTLPDPHRERLNPP